jgi:hypothetical protein
MWQRILPSISLSAVAVITASRLFGAGTAAPVLTNFQYSTNDTLSFRILGESGADYEIDFATTLPSWSLATNLLNCPTNLLVTLPVSNSPAGFFRARRVFYPPPFAPASINGLQINFNILSGTSPFASAGVYRISISPTSNQGVLVPYTYGIQPGQSPFVYSRTSPTNGSLQFSTPIVGSVTGIFTFATTNSGSVHFSNNSASQDATFEVEPISGNQLVPASIVGKTLTVGITGGSSPLATYGNYQIVTTGSGNSYSITPISPNILASGGTYTYAITGGNTALFTGYDTVAGATFFSELTFINTNAGSVFTTVSGLSATQSGTFIIR